MSNGCCRPPYSGQSFAGRLAPLNGGLAKELLEPHGQSIFPAKGVLSVNFTAAKTAVI
jgi:hypothetical protein